MMEWGSSSYLTAMSERGIRIATINLTQGYVAFENGLYLPIVLMRDADGDITADDDECRAIDFGTDEVGFGSVTVNAIHTDVGQ